MKNYFTNITLLSSSHEEDMENIFRVFISFFKTYLKFKVLKWSYSNQFLFQKQIELALIFVLNIFGKTTESY